MADSRADRFPGYVAAKVSTFTRRVIGAAVLDRRTYEDIEADNRSTGQAVVIVVLASVAGGIGLLGLGAQTAQSLVAGIVGSLIGWIAWAALTYLIGTHLLPEPQTRADVGELLHLAVEQHAREPAASKRLQRRFE